MKKRIQWLNARISLFIVMTGCLFYFIFFHLENASGVSDDAKLLSRQQKLPPPPPQSENIEYSPVNLHPWVTFCGDVIEDSIALGYCVAPAGDVNGDGFADVIVGNRKIYPPNFAQIYFGGITTDTACDVYLVDPAPSPIGLTTAFGFAVAKLGDINGDGFDDVIVGAYNAKVNIFNKAGFAYIYFGGNEIHSYPDLILQGTEAGDTLGFCVAGAGDVNGDGYPDIVIGGPMYNLHQGKAWIFFGGPDMDNLPDVIFGGENQYDDFGFSVSGAGDVNGDGYDDVIISARYFGGSRGKIYIYFGGPEMDNVPDFVQSAGAVDVVLGYAVAGVGDLNGDGYNDVAFGAPWTQGYSGRVYVLFGGEQLSLDHEKMLQGEANSAFGSSIASAGDINGDGYGDLIIGGETFGVGSDDAFAGKAYLYFGGEELHDSADAILYRGNPAAALGRSVGGAGDVNGDGLDDLIVGEPGGGATAPRCNGEAHLILGSEFKPIIYLAGFIVEPINETTTQLKIMALVSSVRGPQSINQVELYYNGLATGIMLNDEGMNGDDFAADGIFSIAYTFPDVLAPSASYLVEIVADDAMNKQSTLWPYVVVTDHGQEFSAINHSLANRNLASLLLNQINDELDVATSGAPSILFWGTDSSRLSAADGGLFSLLCIVADPEGVQDIRQVEIDYQGMPTGMTLTLDDSAVDFFPYCGLYSMQISLRQPVPVGEYLLTAKATDWEGNVSDSSPYLHL